MLTGHHHALLVVQIFAVLQRQFVVLVLCVETHAYKRSLRRWEASDLIHVYLNAQIHIHIYECKHPQQHLTSSRRHTCTTFPSPSPVTPAGLMLLVIILFTNCKSFSSQISHNITTVSRVTEVNTASFSLPLTFFAQRCKWFL